MAYLWDKASMSVKYRFIVTGHIYLDGDISASELNKQTPVNSVSISSDEDFVIVARTNDSVSV